MVVASRVDAGSARLALAQPVISDEDRRAVAEAVASGRVSGDAPVVGRFEDAFARWCGVGHGVATGSGSAALRLALASLGIGPGDEIVIPSFSRVAVHHAVAQLGATPVLADSRLGTCNVDPDAVAAAVGPHTAAIVAVHTHGLPCDMAVLARIAHRGGLALVEDAAEAHGATFRGERAGSLADAAAFSFSSHRIVTCGEGGMLVTDDRSIAEAARRIGDLGRIPGSVERYESVGFHDRLPAASAALGLSQFQRVDLLAARRRRTACAYRDAIGNIAGLWLPPLRTDRSGSDGTFAVRVDERFGEDRDALARRLATAGVETRSFYVPVHRQPFWDGPREAPVADVLWENGLLLPSGAQVRDEDAARVAALVRAGSAEERTAAMGG